MFFQKWDVVLSLNCSKSNTSKDFKLTILRLKCILAEEVSIFFAPFSVGVNSKRKEFAPLGANSFL